MNIPLFIQNSYQTAFEAEVVAADENGVRLNSTAFYAASGGQPGDTGLLRAANSNDEWAVTAARKGDNPHDIIHVLPDGVAPPPVGTMIRGQIDWDTRHKYMRMHTLLHLTCSLVEAQITGCQIGAEKSRMDMNMEAGAIEKDAIAAALNALIAADHPVTTRWISDEELLANPALVRSMSVRPPMGLRRVRLVQIGTDDHIVDLQPCGGTHVKSTGEIGRILVTKIENKGKLNRRIGFAFEPCENE